MRNESLSAKVRELGTEIKDIEKMVKTAEYSDISELTDEIAKVEKQCKEKDVEMRMKMKLSKTNVAPLSSYYKKEKENFNTLSNDINNTMKEKHDDPEYLLLLSEYALDYAMQVASEAILFSLKAIKKDKERI